MPLELAELAAGLPFAASFAMAGGISALREGRRRTALNEAMHELRRPLQALALAAPTSSERAGAFEASLRMAAEAVDRLDQEINGKPATARCEVAPLREIVEAAVERWRSRASSEGRTLGLHWEPDDPGPYGDRVALTQVVDNLISNGLDHGSDEVVVVARTTGVMVEVSVVNRLAMRGLDFRPGSRSLWTRISGRSRHGHGLRIVRRVALQHGGDFRVRRCADRFEATIELPLLGDPR